MLTSGKEMVDHTRYIVNDDGYAGVADVRGDKASESFLSRSIPQL